MQQDIKREMVQKICRTVAPDEITCIKFLKKEMTRAEWLGKKEFEYKGAMYDVVNKAESNKEYIFYCLNDEKEELLIKSYNRHFDDNKDKATNNNSRYFFSLVAPATLMNNPIKRVNICYKINNQITSQYQSIWLETINPPPKNLI
jgi:hypothetical protein